MKAIKNHKQKMRELYLKNRIERLEYQKKWRLGGGLNA